MNDLTIDTISSITAFMHHENLKSKYIALATKQLKPGKYYKIDKSLIIDAASVKTTEQLQESINRIKAAQQVTQQEINQHSQFKPLKWIL